jgi:hypothetical protein
VSVRRRVLLKLLRRLLRAVLLLLLWLLVRLRGVVRMVVLRRQWSGLGRRLHWAVLRRTVVWRTVLRMRLTLPLRTRIATLGN